MTNKIKNFKMEEIVEKASLLDVNDNEDKLKIKREKAKMRQRAYRQRKRESNII